MIKYMKSTSWSLYVAPTKPLKETMPAIGPFILINLNNSVTSGSVPAYFKTSLIEPLLKNVNLGPLENYGHVSQLPFLSKILEKQLCSNNYYHIW